MPAVPNSPAQTVMPAGQVATVGAKKIHVKAGLAKIPPGKVISGLVVKDSETQPMLLPKSRVPLWEETNQKILHHSLKRFLPKVSAAEQDGAKVHVFQLFRKPKGDDGSGNQPPGVDPKEEERCAQSVRLHRWDRIPTSELEKLKKACADLRSRQNTHGIPANTETLMKTLQFPDPALNPELYRLYGKRWDRRLAILWGLEITGAGLAPETAIERLRGWSTGDKWIRGLWLGVLPLIVCAVLACGGFALWQYFTVAQRQREIDALAKIDEVVADSRYYRNEADAALQRAREPYSDDQIIEVKDKTKAIEQKVAELEKSLKGITSFKAIAERHREAVQNTEQAKGGIGSASKIVDDKLVTYEVSLEQGLARASDTLNRALALYAPSTSSAVRAARLKELNVEQALQTVDKAIIASTALLQRDGLPSATRSRLTEVKNTAEARRAAYVKGNAAPVIPKLDDLDAN
jgi:hypothetical protein